MCDLFSFHYPMERRIREYSIKRKCEREIFRICHKKFKLRVGHLRSFNHTGRAINPNDMCPGLSDSLRKMTRATAQIKDQFSRLWLKNRNETFPVFIDKGMFLIVE